MHSQMFSLHVSVYQFNYPNRALKRFVVPFNIDNKPTKKLVREVFQPYVNFILLCTRESDTVINAFESMKKLRYKYQNQRVSFILKTLHLKLQKTRRFGIHPNTMGHHGYVQSQHGAHRLYGFQIERPLSLTVCSGVQHL